MIRTLFEVLRYAFAELAINTKRRRLRREHESELARLAAEARMREKRKADLAEELQLREQERIASKHELEENPYE